MWGSFCRSHKSLGAVKPSKGRLATVPRSPSMPMLSRIWKHWAVVRTSFQRRAGRMTSPRASRKTELCICPLSPIAAISTRRALRSADWSVLRTASVALRHHISGRCSDQPGRGTLTGCSTSPSAMTLPSLARSMAFTAVVPMSMPRVAWMGASMVGDFIGGWLNQASPSTSSGRTVGQAQGEWVVFEMLLFWVAILTINASDG